MRWSTLGLAVLCLYLGGCAAVFRDSKPKVRFESDPAGAEVRVGQSATGTTPAELPVERQGTSNVTMSKPGHADHHGIVKKKINAGWLAVDIVTCVFPVALCIPVLVDAISGAWFDVEKVYQAKLEPAGAPADAPGPTPAPTGTGEPAAPPSTMSESERKAAARAAFIEGVQLQEKGNAAEALARFEAAQKLYDAPSHQLRIAQTQAATGKLVEAQETYESLTRRDLPPGAPEVFREAQETGKKELAALKPRIPSLRLQVQPAPSSLKNLTIAVNDKPTPVELVGIARPVNPGTYKITASATGYKLAAPIEVELKEGTSKTVDVKLTK